MRTFTDTTGHVWSLSVTVRTVKQVKEATDVLLTELFDDDCALLARLSKDVCTLVDIIWVICQSQAEEAGVSEGEFAERLGGDALGDASEAFARAIADFFTSPEQRRGLHAMLNKIQATGREAAGMAADRIEELDPHQMAEGFINFASSTLGTSDNHRGTTALVS